MTSFETMAHERTILHVDLDAFFASVEVRENPALAGKPVVVGADPKGGRGRGVVAAASYEARAFGIRSAMPISQAYRRCPGAVYLRPRMKLYATASEQFLAMLRRYTDLVEPLSIDEAFLDVTGSQALFGDGETIARRIKSAVRGEQQLTASIGVAPSKFVAKIASDLRKPDGLVVVPAQDVRSFLAALAIGRMWGAGPKAVEQFRRIGVATIGDLARMPLERLAEVFGDGLAGHFHQLARGIDPREVNPESERKSIGRETTFPYDLEDRAIVERTLLQLVEEVARRLRSEGTAGQIVTVKLRTGDFVTVTRRETLVRPADTTEQIWPVARRLLARADRTGRPVRLIGVSLSMLAEAAQLSLFDPGGAQKQRRVADAVDSITARFGDKAITRAELLERAGRTRPKGRTGE